MDLEQEDIKEIIDFLLDQIENMKINIFEEIPKSTTCQLSDRKFIEPFI